MFYVDKLFNILGFSLKVVLFVVLNSCGYGEGIDYVDGQNGKRGLDIKLDALERFKLSEVKIKLPACGMSGYVQEYKRGRYKDIVGGKIANVRVGFEDGSGARVVENRYCSSDFVEAYIKGLSYLKLGNKGLGIRQLRRSAEHNEAFSDYINYKIGEIYYKDRSYVNAIKHLKKARERVGMGGEVMLRLLELEGQSYLRLSRYSKLIKEYKGFLKRVKGGEGIDIIIDKRRMTGGEVESKLMYYIGKGYEGKRDYKGAIRAYLDILKEGDNRRYKSEAINGIKRVSGGYKRGLTDEARIYLINYYQTLWYKKRVSKATQKLIKQLTDKIVREKELQVETKEGQYTYYKVLYKYYIWKRQTKEAKVISKKIKEVFGFGSKYEKMFAYEEAQVVLGGGGAGIEEGLAMFKKILHEGGHPKVLEAAQVVLKHLGEEIYNASKEKGVSGAREYGKLVSRLFELGYESLVERVFFRLIGKESNRRFLIDTFLEVDYEELSPYKRVKYTYWLGELYIDIGEVAEGVRYLKKALYDHGRNYYTGLSLERLESLLSFGERINLYRELEGRYKRFFKTKEFRRRYSLVKVGYNFRVEEDELFWKGYILFQVGNEDQGYELLKGYVSNMEGRGRYYLVLSKLFKELGRRDYVIRYSDFLVDYLNGVRNHGYIIPVVSEEVYPLYYNDIVYEQSKRYGVDKHLVMAVIREESRFNEKALSVSGAKGLMQILQGVGEWLEGLGRGRAGRRGINLYDSKTNISLGVKYLRFLLRRQPLSEAVASYNGGPTRIRNMVWKFRNALRNELAKENKTLNDKLVIELIDIEETRKYVRKVLGSYYIYRRLYEKRKM